MKKILGVTLAASLILLLGPAAAHGVDRTFRVATANIQHTMTEAAITEDVGDVASYSDVVLWQEIVTDESRNAIRGLAGWSHSKLENYHVPISWRTSKWQFVNSGVEVAYQGTFPTRYVVWTVLEHLETNIQVRFINTHFTVGGYNGELDPDRQAAWDQQFNHIDGMIETWMQGSYRRMVGGGDYNRVEGTPKYVSEQEWFLNGAIDKLFGINAARLTFVEKYTPPVDWNTDHGPRFAKLSFP